jgi:ABC-type sugar transport system substrate-binding protein
MTKFRTLLAVLACGAVVAAGCGSSKSTTAPAATTAAAPAATTAAAPAATTAAPAATTAAAPAATTAAPAMADDAGFAAAKANVDKFSKADGGIGVTKPLTKKPEKKSIAWLECDVPTCAAYLTPGFKNATTALGWDLKIVPMKSTDPGPAFQQAIDAGVQYIASTGLATAQYKPQLEAAKAKGIGVLSCFGTDDPSAASGLLMQCGDETFVQKTGPLMADWAIVDSKSKANALVVTIRDFPVLVVEEDAYKAQLAKNCKTCTVDTLNVTLDDLIGGKIPAAVASKLQANPKINYVFATFGDLPGGVTAALKTAGLDKNVKVYGQDFSKVDLDEIIAGTMGAWSADPKGYAGWLMVDAAARLSVGMPLDEERAAAPLPTVIVNDAKFATELLATNADWMPPGAEAAFKKLWGV